MLLAIILATVTSLAAHAQFQTAPDAFELIHSQTFNSGGLSVLDNDPQFPDPNDPAQRVLVRVTKEPEHGELVMNVDGTFTYTPEPLYTGPDQFEYVIDYIPLQVLAFDPAQNNLNLDATVDTNTALGAASDDQDIAIIGTLWVDIGPTGNLPDAIQIVDLDIRNNDALNLKLDFGNPITLGSLIIDAAVNDIDFGLNVVGPKAATQGPPLNGFTQAGNKLGLAAHVQLQGTGLLNGQVPSEPQDLITETDFELTGLVLNNGGQVTVILTINSHNEFQLEGNDVEMDITGQISAVGPHIPGATSDAEVVNLNIFSPVAITEEETPPALERLHVYPNPVKSSATVAYTLTRPGRVNIQIYDLLGREIETLQTGHERAGETRLTWNASSRPRGLYFLKVTSEHHIQTRPILLQ